MANPLFALTKIVAGVLGNSYALIADGIESCADVFSSLVVCKALRVSTKPADDEHPYGYGKAESVAGVLVALGLLGAAVLIAVQSVREVITPHHAPAPFTLIVLLVVVVAKEALFRCVGSAGANWEARPSRATPGIIVRTPSRRRPRLSASPSP